MSKNIKIKIEPFLPDFFEEKMKGRLNSKIFEKLNISEDEFNLYLKENFFVKDSINFLDKMIHSLDKANKTTESSLLIS